VAEIKVFNELRMSFWSSSNIEHPQR